MGDQDTIANPPQAEDDTETKPELTKEEAAQAKLKESIGVVVEDVGVLRKKLTVTIPRETIDERLQEQFDELRQEALVPGFRKGHAPIRLIEKRFGSEVGDQLTASLLSSSYLAAVERESLDTLGDPLLHVRLTEERSDESGRPKRVEIDKLLGLEDALEHIELPKTGSFAFACEVDLRPKFDLPKLDGIPVEKPVASITDEDIETEIKRIMGMRGTYRPVENEPVQANDLLVGTARLLVGGNAVRTEDNAMLSVRDGRYFGVALTGFGDAGVGRKAGETVSVEVTLPEDFEDTAIRGQQGTFEMQILDAKRFEAPALDESTVTGLGFESVEEFRGWLKERMEGELERLIRTGLRSQIGAYLLASTQLELPEAISQRMTERAVDQRRIELYRQGVHDAEASRQVDEYRSTAAQQARDELKMFFIMERVSADRDVDVTEEELNSAISAIAQRRNRRFDRVRDELVSTRQLNSLYMQLRDEKILDLLLEEAEVRETRPETGSAPAPEGT